MHKLVSSQTISKPCRAESLNWITSSPIKLSTSMLGIQSSTCITTWLTHELARKLISNRLKNERAPDTPRLRTGGNTNQHKSKWKLQSGPADGLNKWVASSHDDSATIKLPKIHVLNALLQYVSCFVNKCLSWWPNLAVWAAAGTSFLLAQV